MKNNEILWTFKTWLSRFDGVDLPIGDLASECANDPEFPNEDRFGYFIDYFEDRREPQETLEVFADAWTYYKATCGEVGTLDSLEAQLDR